jgi:hypothetical protein
MKHAGLALILAGWFFSSPAAAMCYVVYDAQSRIVYRGAQTPVDLSGTVTAAMRGKFPGGQLVISNDMRLCTPIEPTSPVDPFTGAAVERTPIVETVEKK